MHNYCFSDLHGMYDLWQQIKEYAQPQDKLYFLGDATDRGPDGIKIMQELLSDPRVTYLKGNHEEILQTAGVGLFGDEPSGVEDYLNLWFVNGGYQAYFDYDQLNILEKASLLNKVKTLETHTVFHSHLGHDVLLSHSGYGLRYTKYDLYFVKGDKYLWDRHHFDERWSDGYENVYMVHGHTPVGYVKYSLGKIDDYNDVFKEYEILTYADGHKFDIDLGSFNTGVAALFDLDELKVVKYFTTEVKNGQ